MRAKKGLAEKQSGYHGVVWWATRSAWLARYTRDGRTVFVGQFKCPHKAAIALSEALIDRENEIIKTAQSALNDFTGLDDNNK